ncbi:MAG: archease [Planctomycetota bacterium]|jgi:SHS2 domain-containing protein
MYETFDHTADVGLRIRARQFDELLIEAGRALTSVLVEDPSACPSDRSEAVELSADSPEDLLFDWMSELVYLFSTRRFVPREYEVVADGTSVKARLHGWQFDPDRHAGGHEVKAITYHGLQAKRVADGWIAEVILDI